MRWTEKIIEAHEKSCSEPAEDRRATLIRQWKQYRCGKPAGPAVELAIQVVGDGTANEVELGFYVLMDLGLSDPSLLPYLHGLVNHPSAKVRRSLAFQLLSEFPQEFCAEIYRELLHDKAASVRSRTVVSIGMRDFQPLLADLMALRLIEKNPKVIETLDYWIPLLKAGYRVDDISMPGRLYVTALTGRGIASTTLETNDPNDSRIPDLVAKLRSSRL